MSETPRFSGLRRLLRLPSVRSVERDVDDELAFHFESRIADLVRSGMAPNDARRTAEQEYGDLTASRAELAMVDRRIRSRERRVDIVDIVRQDFAYAARSLRRQPGFAATVAITLALAVGANAAVFSLVDPLLFRPPPGVIDPGAVRRLYANAPKAPWAVHGRAVSRIFSYPAYVAIRSSMSGVARVAAYRRWDSSAVRRGADSLYANVNYATSDFLPLLGVRASRGRLFTAEEDDVNAPAQVCVISGRFARRAFADAGDPIGQSVSVRERPCVVVGIAGNDFEGIDGTSVDIWAPFSGQPRYPGVGAPPWYQSQDVYIPLVARVDPGVDDGALEARATVAFIRSYESKRKSDDGRSVLVGPILEQQGPVERQQEVAISTRLAIVAGIVLLIACANIANLFLARAVSRRREIAVRLALGVSRARLASQFLAESMVLAGIAGAAALLVAHWSGGLLRVALLPRVHWIAAPLGGRVFFFTIACTIAAACIAAIIPAILASRGELTDALKSGGRDGMVTRSPLRSILLVIQAALSVVLVVGAALFVESLRNVRGVDLGYESKRLIVTSLFFPDAQYHPERGTLLPQIAERIAAVPGVAGVTYSAGAPLSSWFSGVPLFVPGRDSATTSDASLSDYIGVMPNYFAVTGSRIIAGRGFLASDLRGAPPVMIVSNGLARAFWPHESPLGKCLIPVDRKSPCYTIVGIAQDAHELRIVEKLALHFYVPLSQMPHPRLLPSALAVRVGFGEPAAIADIVRNELRLAFPTAQANARTAVDILAPQLTPWRLGAQLFAALGLLALLVAAVGIYSIVSFTARQRVHEMGIRIALGARTSDLLRLVVAKAVVVVAVGVALGILGALASGQYVASLLYGVTPHDPVAMLIAATTLLIVGVVASLGPAWRASRVDAALVLREE